MPYYPDPLYNPEDELDKLLELLAEACKRNLTRLPAPSKMPKQSFTPLHGLNFAASSSVYTPLKDNEIRLVRVLPGAVDEPIRCVVFNVESSVAPAYTALSYVCKCFQSLDYHMAQPLVIRRFNVDR